MSSEEPRAMHTRVARAANELNKREKELAAAFIDGLRAANFMRHCTTCNNWDAVAEVCTLYNARPPAPVIVSGCDQHSDEIPF